MCFKDGLLSEALESLLTSQGNFEVASSAPGAAAAIAAAKTHRVQVFVIVADTLGTEDLKLLTEAKQEHGFRYLVIGRSQANAEASGLPFDRFVGRTATAQRLFRAIAELGDRRTMRPLAVRPRTGDRLERRLTPREHEIALKVAEGCSNRDIARDLRLGEQTVKNAVSVIMRKLVCENRVQVALKLARLLPPPSA